jgi:lipopolysaccharide export system protein LptA
MVFVHDTPVKASLVIFILTLLVLSTPAFGQKKVKIEEADRIEGGRKDGENFRKLVGNVRLRHQNTIITCDTAKTYSKRNYFEAVGNVRIIDGDSIRITSYKLIYEGNSRTAKLRGNVVFTKKGMMTLYTERLDYDRNVEMAKYYDGGKLVDSTNTLTSDRGYFNNRTDMASFKKDVVGVNEENTLTSDTLQYNTRTKIVYFHDYTEVVDNEDGTVFTYTEGQYDTRADKSDLKENVIETEAYILKGKQFVTDEIRGMFMARDSVVLISKENDIVITGEKGDYYEEEELTKIYENALMKMDVQGDTLFLRADTLVSIDSDIPSVRRLLAYGKVKIFKSNLQAVSDSLAYHLSDSIIYFYQDPILWTGENQMKADSINIEIRNGNIDKLNMSVNSFVVSQDTLFNFNQVRGKQMTAFFNDSEVVKVDVTGNGESLYYALTDDNANVRGMNKAACSNMVIKFENNEVHDIVFYVNPDAEFVPPHELSEPPKLKGFSWSPTQRPTQDQLLTGVFGNVSEIEDDSGTIEDAEKEGEEPAAAPAVRDADKAVRGLPKRGKSN